MPDLLGVHGAKTEVSMSRRTPAGAGCSLPIGETSLPHFSRLARPLDTVDDARLKAAGGLSWDVRCGLLAVAASVFGMEWDIAWHRSIGRDTFWTPAHMMIQFCGVMTAIVCGYLVLRATFGGSSPLQDHSVRVLGFRGPLGALVAAWGGLAMLVSAPFDNWWHDAYGLDVQILSPPHVLLFIGLRMVTMGYLIMLCTSLNRADAARHAPAAGGDRDEGAKLTRRWQKLQHAALLLGGLILTGHMLLLTQGTEQPMLHGSGAYCKMAVGALFLFPMLWEATRHRWAATWAAGIYMLIRVGEVLLFPLIPATPRLGPVLHPITHLVPAQFPILLLVPAVALDLLWQATRQRGDWQRAIAGGFLFVVTLLAVEWPFATFLASPASENRLFDTMDFDYRAPLADQVHHFSFPQTGMPLIQGFAVAITYAIVACWVGLRLGRWMRSLQR